MKKPKEGEKAEEGCGGRENEKKEWRKGQEREEEGGLAFL